MFMKCVYPGRCVAETMELNKHNVLQVVPSNSSSNTSYCTNGTDVTYPMCGVCLLGYTKDGQRACELCGVDTVAKKWSFVGIALLVLVISFSICKFTFKKTFKKKLKKIRMLWLDMLRIVTIVVTFSQISTSMPAVVQISYPDNFVRFLELLSVVNFDFLDFTGIACGYKINHGHKLVVIALIPVGKFLLLCCGSW